MTTALRAASFEDALAAYRAGQLGEARSLLDEVLLREPVNATAWNLRGYLERDIGDARAAANAFDRALEINVGDAVALSGRARIALERGEADVIDRYAAALSASAGDPRLLLEQTEARLGQGDIAAIEEFAAVAERLPAWAEGQIALARMRWESLADENFDGPARDLLHLRPNDFGLWRGLIDLLSGIGRYAAAADLAHDARQSGGGHDFALLEAVNAGRTGDVVRADRLFSSLPASTPGLAIHLAVHRIRQGAFDRARAGIDDLLAKDPFAMGAWALAELLYRKLGDERSEWLSSQAALVRTFDLALEPSRFAAIRELLATLNRSGVQMVEQSVRTGTQTRWRLFDRLEPELVELKQAIETRIADYIAQLPPRDDTHPLLRHRDQTLVITGSWSVRLTSGGYHVSHVHPLGLLSSACYFVVPDEAAAGEGALELGRPPADLMLDLEPLHVITPVAGRLTLFPSYLHHGTTTFTRGERLSVAFDVNQHPLALGPK